MVENTALRKTLGLEASTGSLEISPSIIAYIIDK
jgi:hypothetical protein